MGIVIASLLIFIAAGIGWHFAPSGWRTVAVNGAIFLLGIATEIVSYLLGVDWKTLVPPEYAPYAVMAVNVINIALRSVTTTPIGTPKE